ncbi:hypothetical protein DUZ99_16830 [Xylanibacillus composti]|uniref:Cytochrome c oxidase subunit 2 n=1 Tax=Xylanibacillus composti TaxID=1572762 RepID=A0A8J4M3D5_9BACL|nr:hypothetical protein [Xylanibacillus composti]MDT9726643.1 hypothetical protein [Xylanibacillus composti]GIQ69426.1 hypothetical protein XYCOK13_22500 [Xylanibacillus composti]
MHKWIMFALFIAASAAAVVFSITMIEPKEGAEEEVGENELRFVLSNFEFDQQEYHVKLGETMNVSMRNKEGIHGVAIEGYDIDIHAGDSVEVTFDKPGTFELVCSVMCGLGHAEMVATLVVE